MKTRRALSLLAALTWTWVAIGGASSPASDDAPGDILRHNYPVPQLPLELNLPPSGGFLVRVHGCLQCHTLGDQGARGGVDLQNVGRRLNVEAIERLLVNPRDVSPDATMPAPRLTRAEVLAIAEYLSQLR